MRHPAPSGDPVSCCAAAADLAACARWLRDGAEVDPALGELATHAERLGAALTELGIALSRAQSVLGADPGLERVQNSAVSQLGRARARLRRACESIATGLADPPGGSKLTDPAGAAGSRLARTG